MTGRIWRMTAFDLKPNQTWPFSSAGHCVVFVPVGRAKIEGPDRATEIAAGEAVFLAGGDVVTSTEGAWIFELSADLVVAKHHSLVPVLSRRAQLPDGDLIIRADRIDQPAGLTTPSHHHRGPGIRRLVTGRLLAEVGDHIDLITTGQAWFESGLEHPVHSLDRLEACDVRQPRRANDVARGVHSGNVGFVAVVGLDIAAFGEGGF